MAYLIPIEYHPKNAERKEEIGAFDLYHFEDGAKLLVRRYGQNKVLDFTWAKKRELPSEELASEYRSGKTGAVVRFLDNRLAIAQNSPEKFLVNYRRMLAARVRFETPAAWLKMPESYMQGSHIIVTRFNDTKKPLKEVLKTVSPEALDRIFQNAARELGKMHGAGIVHGHPHVGNILVDEQSNVSFIDPKHITTTNSKVAPPMAKPIIGGYNPQLWGIFDKEMQPHEENDLQWLYGVAIKLPDVNWKKVNEQYKRGYEEGKRRIEMAKL